MGSAWFAFGGCVAYGMWEGRDMLLSAWRHPSSPSVLIPTQRDIIILAYEHLGNALIFLNWPDFADAVIILNIALLSMVI